LVNISRSGNVLDIGSSSGHHIPDREFQVTIEEIGTVVRQTRLAQGLRQDQLAAAAGVGLRFLVELERGKPTVRLDKVLAVLNALGCRLDVTPPSLSGRGA
jgi:y4mF family transcriptional regulator